MRRIFSVYIHAGLTAVFIEESSDEGFIRGWQLAIDSHGVQQLSRACHSTNSPILTLLQTQKQWEETNG